MQSLINFTEMKSRKSREIRSLFGATLLASVLDTPTIYSSGRKSEPQSILNGTQKSKRSKRNKQAKQSRKQNRK